MLPGLPQQVFLNMDGQHSYSPSTLNLPIRFEPHSIILPPSKEEEESRIHFIEQYVCSVADFSSQYGSDTSISYTAYNLTGKPSKFPDYGDFPQAFVMKTYGNWWKEAPSGAVEYMPQNTPAIPSQDYVDITFETSVFPFRISIYETYNPGSIVRVWAASDDKKWALLWEGEPVRVAHQPRLFCPVLRPAGFKTSLLRIEFNHSMLDYYTGIDAVLLVGTEKRIQDPCRYVSNDSGASDLIIASKLTQQILELNLHTIPPESTSLSSRLQPWLAQYKAATADTEDAENDDESRNGIFERLPDEAIVKILGYLDLVSLTRVAKTNRHMNRLAYDPFLYRNLTLKPYWNRISSQHLLSLSDRCRHIQRLDLSWCGCHSMISAAAFLRFLKQRCSGLTHLRVSCCRFVNNQVVKVISEVCTGLKELALRNCSQVSTTTFLHLTTLTSLESLDLYRTVISDEFLIAILKVNPLLKHLNIGSCSRLVHPDQIAATLGTYNRYLRSVDMWKLVNFTQVGLVALSRCSLLEELDLGWCFGGQSLPADCVSVLAHNCPQLKKLFLTALRGVTDRDLEPFVHKCKQLEQLDLTGARGVTNDGCLKLLMHLPCLRLLDVSFCENVSDSDAVNLRRMFPNVAIKRSFQTEANRDF